MISQHFNEYVYVPTSKEEWIAECKRYIENYKFPCVSEMNGFHVYVSIHLKNYYSFKNMYTVTNMGLIRYNKRFVALRASAPGTTHDACLLPCTNIFKNIIAGDAVPNKAINLIIIGCLRKTPKIQMNLIIIKNFALQECC